MRGDFWWDLDIEDERGERLGGECFGEGMMEMGRERTEY